MGKNKRKAKCLSGIAENFNMSQQAQIGQQETQQADGLPTYIHITQNEYLDKNLRPKKLNEDDIATCEYKYDANNPESACGESCLNVITSTECTPGYCPCDEHCKNQAYIVWRKRVGKSISYDTIFYLQKFQNREYAKTKLVKTEGRGWGLLADEHIKAGRFIIEYCGEVISSREAGQRQLTYEDEGLIDAYMISLGTRYFIDATRKGSLARFINHSCEPNCETRKWTVLGRTRVGIFAKTDISLRGELVYDYNFEWYGGATVPCLCGAEKCSIYLGAKSQRFQENYRLSVDEDERRPVEDVPLYDTGDELSPVPTESLMYGAQRGAAESVETERKNETKFSSHTQAATFSQTTNPMTSRISSKSASHSLNFGAGPSSSKKRPVNGPKQKTKAHGKKYASSTPVAQWFASKQAREEVAKYEELKNKATSNLNAVYDDIRPEIEAHEMDSLDNVPISIAGKWIDATCEKYKADINSCFSIFKNVMFFPKTDDTSKATGSHGEGDDKD